MAKLVQNPVPSAFRAFERSSYTRSFFLFLRATDASIVSNAFAILR